MEIFFSDIPDEGLPIAGKLSPQFFDLKEDDSIQFTSDFSYDLVLYAFDEAVVLTGQVSGQLRLQCVTCLEYFSYDSLFENWNSEIDIEDGQVKFDPRIGIRDELLLVLPSVPHCDELVENRTCPKAELLEQFEHDETPLEESEAPDQSEDVWGALDQLEPNQ